MSKVCLTPLVDSQPPDSSQRILKKKEAPCHQHERNFWSRLGAHSRFSLDLASCAAFASFLKNVDASLIIPSSLNPLVLVSFVPL